MQGISSISGWYPASSSELSFFSASVLSLPDLDRDLFRRSFSRRFASCQSFFAVIHSASTLFYMSSRISILNQAVMEREDVRTLRRLGLATTLSRRLCVS